jgi:hypothetical protein
MGTKLKLSMDDLTLEDMELFEDATGKDMLEVLKPRPVIDEETGRPQKDPDDPKGRPLMAAQVTTKAFIGLAYIAMRRTNPKLTLAEVKKMPIKDIDFEIEQPSGDGADPTAEPTSPDA